MAKAPQLLDMYGRPIEQSMLTVEVAGPSVTGVRSPIAGSPADGLNPVRLAHILREAVDGDPLRYFEMAEQIEERDLHYTGILGTRRRSVAQLEITVEAATEEKEHIAHADMVRAWLLRDELQDELFDMLDAIGKGISFTEIMWDTSERQWRPARLLWRDQRWFRFKREDGTTPLLRTDIGDVELQPFKFIVPIIRAKSGLPIRSGIARLASWFWMFKAFSQKDWAIFVQTYGQPIRVGKYPAGATDEQKRTLLNAVTNIAGDCAAIIPETMIIEFIESKTTDKSAAIYKERADWLDQQLSKAVLGQTTTTDAISGGHAVSKEHRKVQEDIERADAKALAAVINRDLIQPWVQLEFGPRADGLYPRLRIGRIDAPDLKMVIEGVTKLVPMGMKVAATHVADLLGIPEPDEGAELLTAPRGNAAAADDEELDPAAAAAEREERITRHAQEFEDSIDRLAAEAEVVVGPGTDALVETIRDMISNAGSLEEVRDRLLALRPNMPVAGVASLMRLALVMAELTGRSEAVNA